MNSIDLFILGIMLLTALIGASKGFIRELSSIMAWILAGIATFWDIPVLRTFMRSHFETAFVADIIAGVFVFVIAFTIVSLIGTMCSSFIRGTMISPIDRSLGSLLGGTKGFFIISCVELFAVCFIPRNEMPAQVQQSSFIGYVYELSDWIRAALPQEIRQFFDELAYKNNSSYSYKEETSVAENDEKIKELAILSPKTITEDTTGGVYTEDQKDHLNRVLDSNVQLPQ